MTFYDWPRSIVPSSSIVHAPQSSAEAAISFGHYENTGFVAGSRNILSMNFAAYSESNARLCAWLLQNSRALFRVPVWKSPQLVGNDVLGLGINPFPQGVPFSPDVFFAGDVGFKFTPSMNVAAIALEGKTSIEIDTSRYPKVLEIGHVFGLGFCAYHVREIEYSGNIAAVKITPPLRRDVEIEEFVSLRPSVICRAKSMQNFKSMFDPAGIIRPGSLEMLEVIDERFL